MTKSSINSRQKGVRGERELARLLTDFGFPARRGRQFAGSPDSPDVVCESLKDFHLEVKRVEAGNPYVWLRQADKDAGNDKLPIVCHKRNGEDWIAILALSDLLALIEPRLA